MSIPISSFPAKAGGSAAVPHSLLRSQRDPNPQPCPQGTEIPFFSSPWEQPLTHAAGMAAKQELLLQVLRGSPGPFSLPAEVRTGPFRPLSKNLQGRSCSLPEERPRVGSSHQDSQKPHFRSLPSTSLTNTSSTARPRPDPGRVNPQQPFHKLMHIPKTSLKKPYFSFLKTTLTHQSTF